MKITEKQLRKLGASCDGLDWFIEQNETDLHKLYELAKRDDMLHYANWLIVRLMKKEQCVKYAVFAARQVLHLFETRCPDDNSPRLAIEAAEKYLKNPSEENQKNAAAVSAADAAAVSAADTKKEMRIKILNYGLELIGE